MTLSLAPAAAWGHSTLIATEPARDRIVEHSPEHVLLRFDEPVESALGSIAVYDGDGERVDAGEIMRPRPEEVSVAIDRRLERGTYTVAWRVISADSDPINGAWVFHVEAPGAQPSGVAAQVLEDTPFVVSAFYLSGRFLDFTLLLFCVGGVAALALALRNASAPVRRRLLGVLAAAAAALTVVALVGLGLQGAAAGGGGLGEGFRWESVSSVAETRFGNFSLLRAGLAAALCVVALIARARITPPPASSGNGEAARPSAPRPVRSLAAVGKPTGAGTRRGPGVAAGADGMGGRGGTPAGNGPGTAVVQAEGSVGATAAGSEAGRAVTATTVAALILGLGLDSHPWAVRPCERKRTGLAGGRRRPRPGSGRVDGRAGVRGTRAPLTSRGRRWELAAISVPRFSTMAVVSVACLIVAGAINGYLQVRAWRGLWETEYGILLLIKIGLVLPLLALGAYNNRFAVPRLRARIASVVERRRFLRMAGVELLIMLAIVGVTAGLVNAPPARTEVEMHEASETELELGPWMAHMEIMPATVGPNEIHLTFERGRPAEVKMSARLEERDIGPLRYRARRGMEPGAYVVKRANLSPAGEWEIRIDARRGDFDLFSDTVHVDIGEGGGM